LPTSDGIEPEIINHATVTKSSIAKIAGFYQDMFVGYSVVHANDVYRMMNLNSKRIIQTRDAIWLWKRYNDGLKEKLHQMIMIKVKTSEIPWKSV
jgi:hypothetical protein